MSATTDWPIAIRTVDLARPLHPLTGVSTYSRVRVFISDGPTLLGSVDMWSRGAPTISTTRLGDAIALRVAAPLFTRRLVDRLVADEPPEAIMPATRVSIIVPTCDRPDDLRRCLASLVAQRTRHDVEIVVVDNRPSCDAARSVAGQFPSVRLVTESRPGLSFARNTGIARASGTIIVATDDDVVAPETWIETLVEPFARPDVMAVTGHVLPLELETEAQCRFEAYGGLGKGFQPFEVNGDWFRNRRTAVPTWLIGATANAAFRAAIFADPDIGLMDEALGAGTPTGCSEDTYVFYRILKAGHTIAYEPSAYVWHRHRASMESLRSQIYAYSKGHVAYHLMTWLADGDRRALVRLFYSLPKTYARRAWQRIRRHSDYPLSLILLEVLGNLAGPYALWRSKRRARRLGLSERLPLESAHAVSMEGPVAQGPAAQPAVAPLARPAR
ncbi:MAG: glycosyltransferase [Vicinamibacterales bacterium]